MSHIEKEKLIKTDILSIANRVRHAFNQGYELGFKDGKEKAKVSEQKPFINKPCVSEKVCEHDKQKVLDKIRAEIEALNPVDYVSMSSYEGHRGASDMKDDVLQIIDKYRGSGGTK